MRKKFFHLILGGSKYETAVNKALVGLYWDIGRLIVERQNAEGWGKGVVEQLSTDLRIAFPSVRGFSTQNLWYMRQFFQEYTAQPKLQPLVGEIDSSFTSTGQVGSKG